MARRRAIWAPAAALAAMVGAWYALNLMAYAASIRTLHAADAKVVATGHPPVFGTLPSVWDWQVQQTLRPAMFGVLGAGVIAILLRQSSRWPLFLVVGAVPVVVGHGNHLHGWWAPGPGIDQWTFGAGVGVPGLDLSTYGAGPSWTLFGGTALAVAAVLVPTLLVRPMTPRAPYAYFLRALPWVGALTVAAALAAGELNFDNTGGSYGAHEMWVTAGATAFFGVLAAFVATDHGFLRVVAASACGAGLVTVSGLNPGAMLTTKLAAFAAAAGVVVLAAGAARRPPLRWWLPRAPHGDLGSPVVG